MLKTIQIALDSLTKEQVEEFTTVYVAVDGKGYQLHLSPDSLKKLNEALEPFLEGEDDSISPKAYYGSRREAVTVSTGPTVDERAAIAAFVEGQGLGHVGPRGRVRREFVEAWEAAGRPGM